jgi:tartrate-resistant acid phosphatase type 5
MPKRLIGNVIARTLVATLLVGGLVGLTLAHAEVSPVISAGTLGVDKQLSSQDTLADEGGFRTKAAEATLTAYVAGAASTAQGYATPPGGSLPSTGNCDTVRFAVIGDYGAHSRAEQDVANLVTSWQPDLIITTGDNNYGNGTAGTIDLNIGQFYSAFIYPYYGRYTTSNPSPVNRFFPTLGNHDWHTGNAQPYIDYLTLPGNERYYDFVWGPVQFFALDSDRHEPDGITSDSAQAAWLKDRLAASTATWKVVYLHHPPFSSGPHGSTPALQWPYAEWGASAVLAGHDHTYERIMKDGLPYFVNGLGGGSRYSFQEAVAGSQVRYRADYGAMLVEATCRTITFQFYTRQGDLVDVFVLHAPDGGTYP